MDGGVSRKQMSSKELMQSFPEKESLRTVQELNSLPKKKRDVFIIHSASIDVDLTVDL